MVAVDYLKSVRDDGYHPEKPPLKGGKDDPNGSHDPDKPNDTSRIIMLSDDEQKSFQGSQPGEELACEVRGNLEEDGHFHVMSVKPLGGASSYGEDQMADQVAGRLTSTPIMRPQLQISPS